MLYTTAILVAHFVGDFLCQPRKWADVKHKDDKALMSHVSVYAFVITVIMAVVCAGTIPYSLVVWWGLLNCMLHFGVDYVTSRLFHKNWEAGNKATAINIFGFDQLLHYLCLFGTFGLMP